MALAPDASYWACEIDTELVAALAGLDEIMPVRLTAASCDLVTSPPAVRGDVALMLKTVTTIDQQSAGGAGPALAAAECRHVIVWPPPPRLSVPRRYSAAPPAAAHPAA